MAFPKHTCEPVLSPHIWDTAALYLPLWSQPGLQSPISTSAGSKLLQDSALLLPTPCKVSVQPSWRGKVQTEVAYFIRYCPLTATAPVPGTCWYLHDWLYLPMAAVLGGSCVSQKPWPVTEVLWEAGMPAIWTDFRHDQKYGLATSWSCLISSRTWVWTPQFKSWQGDKPIDSCFFLNHNTSHLSTSSGKAHWQVAVLDTEVPSDTNWDVSCSRGVI